MRARLIGSLIALLLLVLNVGVADAAEVRVFRSTLESQFPQAVSFRMEGGAVGSVRRVVLNYRVVGRRAWVSEEAPFSQGNGALQSELRLDLSRRYIPPGTALQFQWLFEDAQGEQARSETFEAVVEDRRFQWRGVRAGPVEVTWYRGDDAFGRGLAGIASRALAQLAADTGVALERPVRVLVYGDLEEFRSASYRGGLEWVGGTFYPRENVILVFAPPDQQGSLIAQRAIPHELAHAMVHQIADNPFGDVPQWLNEGIATRLEPSFSQQQADALAKAVAEQKLMSLRSISGAFPVDADEALLAYAQSHSAVAFLVERYGRGQLNRLLQAYGEGVTYDDGMRRALGIDMAEFDREWRAWLVPWTLMKATPVATATPQSLVPTPPQEGILERVRTLVDSLLGRQAS